MTYQTINPSNEEIVQEYTEHSEVEINILIEKSDSAFKKWRETTFSHRKNLMLKLSSLLLEKKSALAEIMAIEMGKPLSAGIAEIEKCCWACSYYANESEKILRPEIIDTGRTKSYITYNPLGTILAVMPWNFPFWQVFRFAAPNLMAGNSILLKHAPNVSACSIALMEIMLEAGFPENLFTSILVAPETVPSAVKKIIEHKLIKGVTLTGSGRAGSFLAGIAGQNLKKSVLELGGSDAYIILNDADLRKAAESCAISRMSNSGQTCIAAKRFLVDESVADDFVDLFRIECSKFKLGQPLDENTNMGPLARKDLQEKVHNQVQDSVKHGAKLILGGIMHDLKGYFYDPTILIDISPDMTAFKEEIFGPVASITTFKSEAEAINLANATNYGLGAAIYTTDIEKGEFIAANKLDAGSCFVNEYVKSDPRLPFGGIKESGFGRELTKYGLTEFMNIKTVAIL